jgi:hypothetical protein
MIEDHKRHGDVPLDEAPERADQEREAEEEVDETGTRRLRMKQEGIHFVSCPGPCAPQHNTSIHRSCLRDVLKSH